MSVLDELTRRLNAEQNRIAFDDAHETFRVLTRFIPPPKPKQLRIVSVFKVSNPLANGMWKPKYTIQKRETKSCQL